MIFPSENQKVRALIQGFISSRRIPHAMLIEGASEKTGDSLALYIASATICDDQNAPCGSCSNCHLAEIGSHPDVTTVAPLEGKKNLSVDQIRELRADAFVKPHSASHRIFIIRDAHRMNPQAQNALLKVLEEPPKNVVFILLAPSKTMLLDTIISRCVLISLSESTLSDDTFTKAADEFISLLISGSEYDMLKLLTPFEKSRADMETFFKTLALKTTEKLKSGSGYARVLDKLFDDTKYYLDLLATNINLSLLICLAVSRSKGHLDN